MIVNIDEKKKVERRAVEYRCTCNGNSKALRHRHYMTETIVTDEGYCVHCGNVAFAKTAYSSECGGKRKERSDKKSDREKRTVGPDGKQRGKSYMEEVNIEEFGKTGNGTILSGWKEISRF